MKSASRRKPEVSSTLRGKVRAHDPFELIRWLALSQPDPRKAIAELVQNSLDAGAKRIVIQRVRERKVPCLRIYDDGEGVIPELDRSEALRFIATNIGHSRKRSLSPEERLRLMTQGQYGIGLLGFWSLGQALEMRSVVPGQKPYRLVLYRDRPDFLIEPLRGKLPLDGQWTEVVVLDLHREAQAALVGSRAADYLAAELRGQLLARDVELEVLDRMSRGRASKRVLVRPPRFLGEKLEGLGPIEVPGRSPIRLEVYLRGDAPGDGESGLALYSAGTLVAAGFDDLGWLDVDHAPWTDRRLTGLVDYRDFQVVPGSRRGVVPDEAAAAFAAALRTIEPTLQGILQSFEERRVAEQDRTLIRDLQRAFRDFYRKRPRYAMLPVEEKRDAAAGPDAGDAPGSGAGGDGGNGDGGTLPEAPVGETFPLLAPGPLASVAIRPAALRMERNQERTVRAEARDDGGRRLEEPVRFRWDLSGVVVSLRADGDRAAIASGQETGTASIRVVASTPDREAAAEASVEVLDELLSRSGNEGIPEPEFVEQPGAPWRSRMQEGRWQVNSGHPDFRAILDRPALKLRYLAMLFGKEVVERSHQDPRLSVPLEQLVEVAAFADRNVGAKRKGRSAPEGA